MPSNNGHNRGSKYLTVKLLHGDQVQRLQRVSSWCNEIQAGVNPGVVVIEQGSFDLQLFLQVGFKLCVDVFYYGLVADEREDTALSKPGRSLLGPHRSLTRKLQRSSACSGDKCCSQDPLCPTYSPFRPGLCFCLRHREVIMDLLARKSGRNPGIQVHGNHTRLLSRREMYFAVSPIKA